MARMYPPTIADDHGSRAERTVFRKLKDETPDSWIALHSVGHLVPEQRRCVLPRDALHVGVRQSREVLAQHLLRVRPRGVGVGVVGLDHHVVEAHHRVWGLDPLEDQQLAGILMALEQAAVFFAVFAYWFFRSLAEEERREDVERPPAAV